MKLNIKYIVIGILLVVFLLFVILIIVLNNYKELNTDQSLQVLDSVSYDQNYTLQVENYSGTYPLNYTDSAEKYSFVNDSQNNSFYKFDTISNTKEYFFEQEQKYYYYKITDEQCVSQEISQFQFNTFRGQSGQFDFANLFNNNYTNVKDILYKYGLMQSLTCIRPYLYKISLTFV